MSVSFIFSLWIGILSTQANTNTVVNPKLVKTWADNFHKEFVKGTADVAVQSETIVKRYAELGAKLEQVDPEKTLEQMRKKIKDFLDTKVEAVSKLVEDAESEWENFNYGAYKDQCYPHLRAPHAFTEKCLYRFFAARCNSKYNEDLEGRNLDNCSPCPSDCIDNRIVYSAGYCQNATEELVCKPNSKYNGKYVNTEYSAVHVPTAVYDRENEILWRIKWTDPEGDSTGFFDKGVRENLRNDPTIGWQFFCSNRGFFRYYPAPWFFDNDNLDMFDCRLQPWYINAATNPKLIVILLDISGSMLGQRYEIAKQTIEMIMDTLSDNDYFNIISFNKDVTFASPCLGERLVQATARNKRILRGALQDNIKTIEGIANYDRALRKAFQLLQHHNCTNHYSVNGTSYYNATTCFMEELMETVRFSEKILDESWPCNQAIMLISDGSADTHENIFKEMNKDKRVRVFSYLIGEEVTEFREVRWMACYNRGYFVHISNLADVQGKIQYYIDRMSRPIAQNRIRTPVWTGIYFDRMYIRPVLKHYQYYTKGRGNTRKSMRVAPRSQQGSGSRLVTTVSAPVLDTHGTNVTNNTVLGIMGTSVTVDELQRLAPNYRLGATGYSYMIDNNGYIMFHPQFRPTFNMGGHVGEIPKPNYNSVDVLEVEVSEAEVEMDNASRVSVSLDYNRDFRQKFLNGDAGTEGPYDSLVLLDDRRRVYRQRVTSYYAGIDSEKFPFSLAIAIPEESQFRMLIDKKLKELIEFVEEKDFAGSNWRIHPHWQYCTPLPDEIDPLRHFQRLVDDMKANKAVPEGCSNDEYDAYLLKLILLDAKVSNILETQWKNNGEKLDAKRGVYLVFWATRSGLTRYLDLNRTDVLYEAPQTTTLTPPTTTTTVAPSQNRTDDAAEIGEEEEEDEALAIAAAHAAEQAAKEKEPGYLHFIHTHNTTVDEKFYQRAIRAPQGTYVIEVDTANRVWKSQPFDSAFGMRENFSILITASTAVHLTGKNGEKSPVGVLGFEMMYNSFAEMLLAASGGLCKVNETEHRCFLLDDHGYIIFTTDSLEYSKPLRLKTYFGSLEPDIMFWLSNHSIYEKVSFIDYQAICANETLTGQGHRLLSPFFNILNAITWLFRQFVMLMVEYNIWSLIGGWILPSEAYTEYFRGPVMDSIGLSCDEIADFYLLNYAAFSPNAVVQLPPLSFNCKRVGGAKCLKGMTVALVKQTNLLMVVVKQSPECSESTCLSASLNYTSLVRSHFTIAYAASDKLYSEETRWRDKTKKPEAGSAHSAETVSDSSKEAAEKNKPKPPARCRMGPRSRKAPLRQCVWEHAEAEHDQIECSIASLQRVPSSSLILALIYALCLSFQVFRSCDLMVS